MSFAILPLDRARSLFATIRLTTSLVIGFWTVMKSPPSWWASWGKAGPCRRSMAAHKTTAYPAVSRTGPRQGTELRAALNMPSPHRLPPTRHRLDTSHPTVGACIDYKWSLGGVKIHCQRQEHAPA